MSYPVSSLLVSGMASLSPFSSTVQGSDDSLTLSAVSSSDSFLEKTTHFARVCLFHPCLQTLPLYLLIRIQIDTWINQFSELWADNGIDIRVKFGFALQKWMKEKKSDDLLKVLHFLEKEVKKIEIICSQLDADKDLPTDDVLALTYIREEIDVYTIAQVQERPRIVLKNLQVVKEFIKEENSYSLLTSLANQFVPDLPTSPDDKNNVRLVCYELLCDATFSLYSSVDLDSWAKDYERMVSYFSEKHASFIGSYVEKMTHEITWNRAGGKNVFLSTLMHLMQKAGEEYESFRETEASLAIEIFDGYLTPFCELHFMEALEVGEEKAFIQRYRKSLEEFFEVMHQMKLMQTCYIPRTIKRLQDLELCLLAYSFFTEKEKTQMSQENNKQIRRRIEQKMAEIALMKETNISQYIGIFIDMKRNHPLLSQYVVTMRGIYASMQKFRSAYEAIVEPIFSALERQGAVFTFPSKAAPHVTTIKKAEKTPKEKTVVLLEENKASSSAPRQQVISSALVQEIDDPLPPLERRETIFSTPSKAAPHTTAIKKAEKPRKEKAALFLEESTASNSAPVQGIISSLLVQEIDDPLSTVSKIVEKKMGSLFPKSNGYQVRESVQNAKEHLHSLCLVIKRLQGQSQDATVFSLLVDGMSEAHYLIESLLVASISHTRGFKKEEDLAPIRVHSLKLLVEECENSRSLFKMYWRKLFSKVDRSEVFSRNIAEYAYEDRFTFSSKEFLANVYLQRVGKNEIEQEKFVQEMFEIFTLTMQFVFDFDHSSKEGIVRAKRDILVKALAELSSRRGIGYEENVQDKGHLAFSKMESLFAGWAAELPEVLQVEKDMENLRSNLLSRLRTRYAFFKEVRWEESWMNFSKINHLLSHIAEEFILFCIRSKQDFFPGQFGHDLPKMLEVLDLRKNDFSNDEWLFLQSAMWVYKITRYPHTDVNQEGSPLKMLSKEALKTASKGREIGGFVLSEGFMYASSKVDPHKKLQSYCDLQIDMLLGILEKISKKMRSSQIA